MQPLAPAAPALDLTRVRQGCYRLAAVGLQRPTADRLRSIAASEDVLIELGLDRLVFAPQWRRWLGLVGAADPDELAVEHVRLFQSGSDGALCSLEASQHLGSNLHGGPAFIAGGMEARLRSAGLTATSGGLPADHLVVQLEALSALCGREAESALAQSVTDVRTTLGNQAEQLAELESWVPDLAHSIKAADGTGFYGALAAAIAGLLTHDHDLTRELLRALR